MSDVTSDGKRLIDNWVDAKERLERAKSEVRSAECDAAKSATALVLWILPEDVQAGEKIAVWHGDSMVQVEVTSTSPLEGHLTVRKRGRARV